MSSACNRCITTVVFTVAVSLSRMPSGFADAQSLDDLDKSFYNAGPSPMSSTPDIVTLSSGSHTTSRGANVLSLDGIWKLAENGEEASRIAGDFNDAIDATVPGGIHTALEAAGKIPPVMIAKNNEIAQEKSFKSTWWYQRTFPMPKGSNNMLKFQWIGIRATIWLNGK